MKPTVKCRMGSERTGTAKVELQGHDYASRVSLARGRPLRRWTFRLDAPAAGQVCVAGTFNQWHPSSHPLERHRSGCWFGEFDVPCGQHEYRFVVDGEWRDDPQASQLVPNPCGGVNAVVVLR